MTHAYVAIIRGGLAEDGAYGAVDPDVRLYECDKCFALVRNWFGHIERVHGEPSRDVRAASGITRT